MSCMRVATIRGVNVNAHKKCCSKTKTLHSVMRGRLVRLLTVATVRPPTGFSGGNFHGRIVGICRSLHPLASGCVHSGIVHKRCVTNSSHVNCHRRGGIHPSSHASACITVYLCISG